MRSLLLVALMATMTIAGCLNDDGTSDEMTGPMVTDRATGLVGVAHAALPVGVDVTDVTRATAPAFLGTVRYVPDSTFEPTIGATSDGCLYVTSYVGTGLPGGTAIYRSCDQGMNWTDESPWIGDPVAPLEGTARCFPNSNDPWLHVDRDTDRIFTSDLHALVTSTLSYSDDGGDSWICNVLGGGLPPGVHDHQSITTAQPRTVATVGYDNVVYYCINRVADTSCATSLDGGLGFGPQVPIWIGVDPGRLAGGDPASLEWLCGGLSGHVEADHEGRAFLGRNYCGEVQVAVSEDDGLTWNVRTITTDTGFVSGSHEVRMAADEADNLYAFWNGADGLPYLSVSTDHGDTWSEPLMVGAPGVHATDKPAIYAGGDGMVAFAYIGSDHPDGYDAYDSDLENVTWNGYVGVIYDALADEPTVISVSTNDPADPTHRGICGGTRCGGFGDFIDITIDPEGRPWAAFYDGCLDDCADGTSAENGGGSYATVGTLATGWSLWDAETPLAAIDPRPNHPAPA